MGGMRTARSCPWTRTAQGSTGQLGHPSNAWSRQYLGEERQYRHFAERRFLRVERRWPLGKKPTAADESHAAPLVVCLAAIGFGPTRAQK